MAHFDLEAQRFISFDGAELGLSVWSPNHPESVPEFGQRSLGSQDTQPDMVVIGLHGMNDFAGAFHMAAPWWAERGVTTYAYDQRGFGRSVQRGQWPDPELLREDLRTAVSLVRAAHPDAILAVLGFSMGASVCMTAFASARPPKGVDRLILCGPGLRGWGSMPLVQQVALWASTRLRPNWQVRPPKFVKIEPSDNVEMLQTVWANPLMLRENTIGQVEGLVSLMEAAHAAAPFLPPNVATLLAYGAKDIVVPVSGVKRTARHLAKHVRTAYYPNGYHMLLADLQAEIVFADILSFLRDPAAPLPSGVGPVPGRRG